MESSVIFAEGHHFPSHLDTNSNQFTFVQLSDPQLGLLERYGEKREPPFKWDRELSLVDRAITTINCLHNKPKFVVICGDMVDAEPGNPDRTNQISDLKSALVKISPDIPIFVVPGNHDLGNSPSSADIYDYKTHWGDDYFTFCCGNVKNIVVNSQLYFDSSQCQEEALVQDIWLNSELSVQKTQDVQKIIVFQVIFLFGIVIIFTSSAFQHIPPFKKSYDEKDGYFNLPKSIRGDLLHRYYKAGVRHIFSGHLHFNSYCQWRPQSCDQNESPLEIISSTAVGLQLGQDKSGLRIVRVSGTSLTHKYFSFDEIDRCPDIITKSGF